MGRHSIPPTADDAAIGEISQQAGRGLRWSLLGNLMLRVGSLGLGLVLARLLTPADFGTYAVALAALNFLMHVNDVGIIAATVQWRGRLREMTPTATTLAAAFSFAMYGIAWTLAPAFAELAGSPDAAGPIRVLTIGILIDGLTAVRAGALMRRFEQDKLTQANFAGFVVNVGVAITLALHGAGPYSFVVGYVAGAAVTGTLLLIHARMPITLGFDRAVAVRLMRFGLPLAASLGVEAILLNADYVLVGRYLGVVAIGFYLLAFNVSSWMQSLVGQAIRWVSIPMFSRLAEQESGDAVNAGVLRTMPLLAGIALPVAAMLGALGIPLIVGLYGEKWEPAAASVPFLAVLSVIRLLHLFAIDILASVGATRDTLWINIGWAIALVPALAIGTSMDGIRGTSIAHAAVGVLMALPLTVFFLQRNGVRLRPVLPRLVRPLLGAVAVGIATSLIVRLVDLPSIVELGVGGATGVLIGIAVIVPRRDLAAMASRLRRRRAAAEPVEEAS